MRALIVSCVFPPEPVVSAQTSGQIAHQLVRRGHTITVIAPFPNRPGGVLYPGYSRRLFQRQHTAEKFELIHCLATLSPKSRLLSRLLENITFGLTGGWAALTASKPDVIYANTWPLFATGLLFLVAKLRRVPLVISVQDVYPESLISQDRFQSQSAIVRCLRWLDGVIARGGHDIIVISEKFAATYRKERRVAPERIHVIPNWGKQETIQLEKPSHQFRERKKIPPDAFLVTYGGNIGVAAGVETVIEAFHHLSEEQIYFLVAGAGSQVTTCRQMAATLAKRQVVFHSPWPAEETSSVLRTADLLILPTRGNQSLVSVPSKLITYMLAARPVLALADPQSDAAHIIRQSNGGWVIQPDQPEVLAAKIKEITHLDKAELNRRGEHGRQYALQHLTQETCLPRVVDIIEQAAR